MANWWQSIRDRGAQIKHYSEHIPKDVFLVSLIVLVGVVSFGLGRLSAREGLKTPMVVRQAPTVDIAPLYIGGEVVASRNGTKYHFPWCSGARAMSEKNKVWFKSADAAREAGYTPAGNCKGLQ